MEEAINFCWVLIGCGEEGVDRSGTSPAATNKERKSGRGEGGTVEGGEQSDYRDLLMDRIEEGQRRREDR
ncbi:hypothetical protein SLEP1_g60448 [Rubroshorea leprosula]|uniref:Uncharacterized protein n=1 Tax=Rubroshorea leprosula TaxID=152421 RepID=A0AAV5MZG5_9ROSI|nr:hypothetical protein SLEP1_g60448 [Rubroshorea leprosula]